MKQQQSHILTDRAIDENGLVDKYVEFNNSDFSNSFDPLEDLDYEIHASQDKNSIITKEESMKGTRTASYVGEITSGYDATVQDDYEAGNGEKGQIGKGRTEEVTKTPNWGKDKRDGIGRAATVKLMRHTAENLSELADAFDKMAKEECDIDLPLDDVSVNKDEDFEDLDDVDTNDIIDQVASEQNTKKTATHPLDHNESKDDPGANMSSETGDEWIDIGPGEFNDKRDDVGRAE